MRAQPIDSVFCQGLVLSLSRGPRDLARRNGAAPHQCFALSVVGEDANAAQDVYIHALNRVAQHVRVVAVEGEANIHIALHTDIDGSPASDPCGLRCQRARELYSGSGTDVGVAVHIQPVVTQVDRGGCWVEQLQRFVCRRLDVF